VASGSTQVLARDIMRDVATIATRNVVSLVERTRVRHVELVGVRVPA